MGDNDMAKKPVERRTVTITEAGQVLGIGRSSAYAAAQRGEIPTIWIGHRRLVPNASLRKLLLEE